MRQWLLYITATLASVIGLLVAAEAHAATLKGAEIHIASDVVTLSDVFDGAGAAGDMQIAVAPPPGKTILIDSGTLYGIAVANHIDWQPRGAGDKVIVLRDGDKVSGMPAIAGTSVSAVIPPLSQALTAKGAGEKLSLLLDAGEQQRLLSTLPAGSVLAVDSLDFDPATRHFSATLADAANGQRHAVSGRAIAMVSVPVPTHRITQGDTIRAEDLTTLDQRTDQLRSDAALKPEVLIGKVAKRQLEANLPIQERFLGLPTLIKRGDRVTMIVSNGGIVLTAEGHAENDAGMGEVIRMTNVASNKEISGIVTGTNTAEVRTDTAIIAAAASANTTITR